MLLILLGLACGSGAPSGEEAAPAEVIDGPAEETIEAPAEEATAPTASTKPYDRGLALVAWLDLDEPPGTSRGSRSQAVLLRGAIKMRPEVSLWVYDTSDLTAGRLAVRAAEWGLDPRKVLQPDAGQAAPEVPTTELRGEGALIRRWEGLAPVAELDESLARARTAGGVCWETPLLRPFPGAVAAREVLPGLWMLDGEEPWKVGEPRTVEWLTRRPLPMFVGASTASEPTEPMTWQRVTADAGRALTGSDDRLWRSRATMVISEIGCVGVPVRWGPHEGELFLSALER